MKLFILGIIFSLNAFAADNACLDYMCRDNACFTHSEKKMALLKEACENSDVGCDENICNRYGGCQIVDIATEIATICKNTDGVCVNLGCNAIGNCGVLREAQFVAESCQSYPNDSCVQQACVNQNCGMHAIWSAVVKSCSKN